MFPQRLALSILIVLAALPAAAAPKGANPRPAVKGLSREVAAERARRVSKPRYELSLELDAEAPDFTGTAAVEFLLSETASPLTLDLVGGKVLWVEVNGKRLEKADHNGLFLTLPAAALAAGPNRVVVSYSHPYSAGGDGLFRSKDPVDGRVYLYTDFEPYDANQMFPCFDQPDLRATYRLNVLAPGDWEVVSATPESDIRQAKAGRRLWVFPESQAFSTYLLSLSAGPYTIWKSSALGIPLRLFARRSLAENVEAEEWLRLTQQGFRFFQEYFGVPYPFGKLDQLIVPDFNAGAMENVAAITYSERFVQRSQATRNQRQDRADTILHEMAHQWFGNLVTMRWWDDLWLNESFASFMSSLALREGTEFQEAWLDFLLGMKQWGVWEDQLVTTHPIETDAKDTEQAFANFDGITYGKGASVLKQVAYLLGAENFRRGVSLYLQKRAFGNATRKDFMDALEEASGRKLDEWTRDWLQTAGVNSVRAEFECRDDKISSFRLLQTASPEQTTLRRHRTRIGLYGRAEDGSLRFELELPDFEYAGSATPAPALVGKTCPALVLPNQGDHDYVKTKLDAKSLEAAQAGLSTVADDLDRALLWAAFWNMVQDGELSAATYLDLVTRHVPLERVSETRSKVLETVYGRRINSPSALKYLTGEGADLPPAVAQLEAFFWAQLKKAEPGGDEQKLWFDAFTRVARTPAALEKLSGLLSGTLVARGLELDQDRRWDVVAQLNRFAVPGSRERAAEEAARDSSRRGQTAAIRAEVLRPDWEAKQPWLRKIMEDGSIQLADQKAAMRYLFPFEQASLRRRFSADFYAGLKRLSKDRSNEFLEAFVEDLAPATCRPEDSATIEKFLKANPQVAATPRKELRVARQENDRCLKIHRLADGQGPAGHRPG